MSTVQPGAQSAAARRAAEAEMRTLIATIAPAQQRLTGTVRQWLRKRLPTAHEMVYEYSGSVVISYSPNGRGYEGVLVISAREEDVRLYLNRGKGLPDPEKLLQGSGKLARWIVVEGASTLARPAVARLIEAAVARNPVPFARTGRGPVVIRATTAQARRKGRT